MGSDAVVKPEDEEFYFFTLHDLNSDGFLDGHELRSLFLEDHSGISVENAEELADEMLTSQDLDGDGQLNMAEFFEHERLHGHDESE